MAKRDGFDTVIYLALSCIVAVGVLSAPTFGAPQVQTGAKRSTLLPPPQSLHVVCRATDPEARPHENLVEMNFEQSAIEACPEGTLPVRFDFEIKVPVVTGEPRPEED